MSLSIESPHDILKYSDDKESENKESKKSMYLRIYAVVIALSNANKIMFMIKIAILQL